ALLPWPTMGARMRAAGKGVALLAPGLAIGGGALRRRMRGRKFAGFGELRQQRLHHIGVELQSGGSTQLLASLLVPQPRAVGALAAHRRIRLAGRDDA